MFDVKNQGQPCYSGRLIVPVVLQFLEILKGWDPDLRIPMSAAHDLLDAGVVFLGDPELGLKAGSGIRHGDVGVLDYAMSSSDTVRSAIEVAARYMRLINDALQVRLETEGTRAMIRLENQMVLPRAAEDFQMSAFYKSHAGSMLRDLPDLEFWFTHGPPEQDAEYRRTFAPGTVRFAAPCTAIVFDAAHLDLPLSSADSRLHSVVRKHADLMLAELPKAQNLTEKVRDLVAEDLPHGQPSAARSARQLGMSPRTLGRRLEAEGTTFTALVDDLRQRLAIRYLGSQEVTLAEITFLLGFSHAAAFHRAFKRWTGQTPVEYRRKQGR